MRRLNANLLIVGLVLAMALLQPGRALADDSTSPALPASAATPQSVFDSRGLTHMGFLLVLPAEIDMHNFVRRLRALKSQVQDDDRASHQTQYQIEHGTAALQAMTDQYRTTLARYKQLDAQRGSIGSADLNTHNAWASAINEAVQQLQILEHMIDWQTARLQDLQKIQAGYGAIRMAYINLAMDLRGKIQPLAKAYADLAQDAALAAAIEDFNKTAKPQAKLGPSGLFVDDLAFVRQCAHDVAPNIVALAPAPENSPPLIQATINGKVNDTMVWDSGASVVQLSAATADSLHLQFTDQTPTGTVTVADGHQVTAKFVILDSITLGRFTARHIECCVLPPDAQSIDLLGDTFQKHFVCRLDQQSGQLLLSPLDTSVTQAAAP